VSELDDLLTQILGDEFDWAGRSIDSPAWCALTETGLTRVGLSEEFGGAGGELSDASTVIIRSAQAGLLVPLTESLLIAAHLAASMGRELPVGTLTAGVGSGNWMTAPGEQPIDTASNTIPHAQHSDHIWMVGPTGDGGAAMTEERRPARDSCVTECDPALLGEVDLVGALGRSCQILGALRACLKLSCRYTGVRTQFGRTLASHQVVQHALAAMAGEVAAAETAVRSAVDHTIKLGAPIGAEARLAIAAAKIQTSVASTRVARAAHQLHGAMGLTAEYPLHNYTSQLWSWREDYGSEFYWSSLVVQLIRSEYDGDIWQALTAQSDSPQAEFNLKDGI
jgi:acyl-CoA dehydrogenase